MRSGFFGHISGVFQAIGISFVSASGASYVASGTTINTPASPAGIANGDGLFAVVLARSVLTPPAGWTLVSSQAVLGATAQSLYVYRKDTVTSSDSSTAFTWTQSASGRMGLAYVVCRSSTGTITVDQSSGSQTSSPSGTSHSPAAPTLTADSNGELFLLASCAVVGTVSPSTDTWAPPSGASLVTTATQPDNRLAGAVQARNNGQSNSTPWSYTLAGASANEFASITVRLSP